MSCETCDTPSESMCEHCAQLARDAIAERDATIAAMREAPRVALNAEWEARIRADERTKWDESLSQALSSFAKFKRDAPK